MPSLLASSDGEEGELANGYSFYLFSSLNWEYWEFRTRHNIEAGPTELRFPAGYTLNGASSLLCI